MSFRQFGGINYAPKHNIVASNYNTSNNLLVTQNIGQPNSYINFLSDISGNIIIYGDVDISGNLNVGGDIDCSGNVDIDGNVDISNNLTVGGNFDCSGNVDISGNLTAYYMFLSSGTIYSDASNAVMPKSYIDLVSTGIKPVGQVVAVSTDPSYGLTTQYPVPIGSNVSPTFQIDGVTLSSGNDVLLNDQINNINNGVYTFTVSAGNGQFNRSTTKLPTGSDAKGAFISVLNGTVYSRTGWIQTYTDPLTDIATVGTDSLTFNEYYSLNFKAGQGLNTTSGGFNITYLNVDSSLNFINYLDSTSGTLSVGTNSTNVIIGPTGGNPVNFQSLIQSQKGITGPTGSFQDLTVTNQIKAPGGITGATGSFQDLIVTGQINIPGGSASFQNLTVANQIQAPGGITGGTGSFQNLTVTNQIKAPGGITGATGSFQNLTVANQIQAPGGITGATGSFQNLIVTEILTSGNQGGTQGYSSLINGYLDGGENYSGYLAFYSQNGTSLGYIGNIQYNNSTGTQALEFIIENSNSNTFYFEAGSGSNYCGLVLAQSNGLGISSTISTYNGNLTISNNTFGGSISLDTSGNAPLTTNTNVIFNSPLATPNLFTIFNQADTTAPSGNPNYWYYNPTSFGYWNNGSTTGQAQNWYIQNTGVATFSTVTTQSDYRLKKNVKQLDDSFTVDNLAPVEYDINDKHDMGFLAHEVQEHYPFLVDGEKDGDKIQSINYNGFIALLVKEIQNLKKEVEELKQKIK
jgi:hypothetical protein